MIRRKFIYVICLIGIILLNIFYVDFQFLMLLIISVGVVLISWICFVLAKIGLRIVIFSSKGTISRAKDNQIIIKPFNALPFYLTNSRAKIIAKYSECDEITESDVSIEAFMDKVEIDMKLEPKHCGIMNLEIGRVDLYDYLQLFHSRKKYKGTKTFIVLPEIIELNEEDSSRRDKEEEVCDSYSVVNGDSDEIIDLRNFRMGDSVKHIHWKLSATNPREEFIVKQYAELEDKIKAILIDLSLYEDGEFRNNLDLIYQMAYSIGYYYVLRGYRTAFVTYSSRYDQMEMFEFSNIKGLTAAMGNVCKIKCSKDADIKLCEEFLKATLNTEEKPALVTAKPLKSKDFAIVNVLKDEISCVL